MNGTISNWLKHAGIAVAIQMIVGVIIGSMALGAVLAVWGYWWKEAGEYSVKHCDAPNRPWADFNPFDERRTRDDRMDLLAPLAAVCLVALIGAL